MNVVLTPVKQSLWDNITMCLRFQTAILHGHIVSSLVSTHSEYRFLIIPTPLECCTQSWVHGELQPKVAGRENLKSNNNGGEAYS